MQVPALQGLRYPLLPSILRCHRLLPVALGFQPPGLVCLRTIWSLDERI